MFAPFKMISRLITMQMLAASLLIVAQAQSPLNPDQAKLISVLQSDAGVHEKGRACELLGEIGDKEAVPVLASLLGDERLSAYARTGLEEISGPSATAALQSAARTLKGDQRIGAINSLGVLRDVNSVPLLSSLADSQEPGLAKASLLALGRIADDKAIRLLLKTVSGPSASRPDAAAALLIAAETELAQGRTTSAARLFETVRNARLPDSYRAAAVRGSILASKPGGRVALVIEQLRADDRSIRNIALMTIREVPSSALADVLNAELKTADPDLDVQILMTLIDCHNAKSVAAVKAKVDADRADVREAALTALSQIGSPADAATFLEAFRKNRSPEETAIATRYLTSEENSEVDREILRALETESETANRIRLIRVVAARGMTNAMPELLKQADSPDTKIRVAAIQAIRAVGGTQDIPTLIAYTRSSSDETVRDSASVTIADLCRKSANPQAEADLVLAELNQTIDPSLRHCWLSVLTSLRSVKVLPILQADLVNDNDSVALNAITDLGRWPDPSPIEDLLNVAESSPNPVRRESALRNAVGLATAAAEENQRPNGVIFKWLSRADKASQTVEEHRRVLSGLGRLTTIESFRLLVGHLDDGLENEAGVAIAAMALPLAKKGYAAEVKETLDRIAATGNDQELQNNAATESAAILKQGLITNLFDGHSLVGWEGNTTVWRVEDGAIVAGSMEKGQPRNEFLATVKSFENFDLRLKYKVTGTKGFINGGVQFRSKRVPNSSEVSGYQADLGSGTDGNLYDESRRNRNLAQVEAAVLAKALKEGDWNYYRIRADGNRIEIWLNGVETVDYNETNASISRTGVIALQVHANTTGATFVQYKDIMVDELPASPQP